MKQCHTKCSKVYSTIVFIVAIVLCYLVAQRSFDASTIIIPISRFIEVLIPILGIGALVKYIACGNKGCCCCCTGKCGNGEDNLSCSK